MVRGRRRMQSGQVIILVAVGLLALIGSTALVLLAGSVEWQRNQLQQLADEAALDSALKIGIGCDSTKASAVITEADNFLATQRSRTGTLSIAAGTCATPYRGTDTFAGGLTSSINYPYRAQQQQVEVVLTLTLPISFGGELGSAATTVVRRAVAQQLAGSVPAVSATTLTCAGGQVNVAGSIVTQNAIARSGTCALYAHARYDAPSGTYSDPGAIAVYADGQSWSSAGACVSGSYSGSSNAICADGSELSGHITTSCGTGSTSFLSPGVALVDPNPCAAGTAPTPVAAQAINLPPEPNLDPSAVATLQGTGGSACSAAGVYPNIAANGKTVGTGLGPVPTKDAGGYYHFKPSCYGYLDVSKLSGAAAITNVQTGPEVNVNSSTVTATLSTPSTAGNLLVVTLVDGNAVSAFTGPAGWVRAAAVGQNGNGEAEVWYMANAAAGVTSATFADSSPTSIAQMSEWQGAASVSPVDQTGTVAIGSNMTSATVSTTASDTSAGDLGVTAYTWTSGNISASAGWSTMYHDNPVASGSDYRLALPQAVASETTSSTSSTLWADVIVTFKPGSGGGAGAVLDPGFYHFNGSGFAGGGGICLNGGTLLARDVTLEFVNQAGLSSGTCLPGGGASCSAPCRFGSPPCSIQACPPNVAADPPNALTWFAAPCSTAPSSLGSASCPGSAWCPAGDRSCTNLLIWAPSSIAGQIAVSSGAAQAWLLGSIFWPGTCGYQANGTSIIAGSIACATLSLQAGAGGGIIIGSDAGVSTALPEALLIE